MIPSAFEYLRPESLSEALDLLARYGNDARILSGGQSLIPAMKLRTMTPGVVIDIGRLSELAYVRIEADGLRIGALTTHRDIAVSGDVGAAAAALADAAGVIGDVQIRNRGTIGGSLAHRDPAADYPAPIVASGATLVVTGPDGDREIRADAFYSDAATGLEAGELLREIRIPSPPDRAGSGYLKMAQRATGFTICGVAAVIDLAPDGTIQSASIGITGVGRHAFRATLTEQALLGQRPDPETLRKITADAASGIPPIEDCHASGAYRSRMAGVFTTRAIGKAVERIRA